MADPPPDPDSDLDAGDDIGVRPDRESTTGAPRWVKVFGIIGIVLVLLVVIMLFTGGGPGGHGPRRHTRSEGVPAGQTAPSTDAAGDRLGSHTAPSGTEHGVQ